METTSLVILVLMFLTIAGLSIYVLRKLFAPQ